MISAGKIAAVALGLAAAATTWVTRPQLDAGAQEAEAFAAHRAEIERLTAHGGVMITSNARYASEDNGQTHYGQYFEALPGGFDARGCLWGERDGEVLGVYWYFFMGWDPAAQRGFFYQSSPSGRFGFGHGGALGPDRHWLEQRFGGTGTAPLSRHENRWFGTDSVVTRSLAAESEGNWKPGRTYTWVRRPGGTPPC